MTDQRIFIVAGMPRVGTTFLYHYLQQHPDIVLPATKELNFFSLHYEKGIEHYRSLFPSDRRDRWTGDISPLYFMDPEAPARIREAMPGARVILGVRQPTDWVISFHSQLLTHSRNPPRLEEVCEGFEWEVEDRKVPTAIRSGFIPSRLQAYAEAFGDQLFLYSFGMLRRDPLGLLQCVERFLNLTPHFTQSNFENRYINASNRKNMRWATYLLRQPVAAHALKRLLPDKVIRKVRGALEHATAPKALAASSGDENQRDLLKTILGEDDVMIREIFGQSEILSGLEWVERSRAVGATQ